MTTVPAQAVQKLL